MNPSQSRASFDELLEKVISALPAPTRALLERTPVIVDDEPSAKILRDFGIRAAPGEADLCGLHAGRPLSQRSFFEPVEGDGHIMLFRGPIRRTAGKDRRELARQIRITLLHEIGHLHGLTEEELRAMGYG